MSVPNPPSISSLIKTVFSIDKTSFPSPKSIFPFTIESPSTLRILFPAPPFITEILFFNPPPLNVTLVAVNCELSYK